MDNEISVPENAPPQSPEKTSWLRGMFNQVAGFASKNWSQTASIATTVLLSTTALTTPLLGTVAGAGALMLGSCFLLAKCSDALIDHSAAVGKKINLSPLFIGLGLGVLTSMPELFVSLGAIFHNTPEIGIGNIVGSNIANILLILGVTAAICEVAKGKGLEWKFNTVALVGTTALYGTQLMMGTMSPLMGAAMLGLGAAYMAGSYFISKHDTPKTDGDVPAGAANAKPEDALHPENMPTWFNAGWGLAGLGGLICSAGLLITSASTFAAGIGVSQALIGALAVAVGTSLPELVVNVKTALTKETDMALGNILGSNIFNILMVGGAVALSGATIPATFAPYSPQGFLNFGAFVTSAGLLAATLYKSEGGIKKWEGWAGLGLYGTFVAASMGLDSGVAPAPPAAIEAQPPTAAQQERIPPAAPPVPSLQTPALPAP